MSLFKCLLCGSSSLTSKQRLCFHCCEKFERYRWMGCTRCGRGGCRGCFQLPELSKVDALFRLDSSFARLLSDAKDRHVPYAYEILEKHFLKALVEKAIHLCEAFSVTDVIISPARVQRYLCASWHPSNFLFREMSTQANKFFTTSLMVLSKKGRQAHLNSGERNKNSALKNVKVIRNFKEESYEFLNKHPKCFLVLDDVLTSGATAQMTRALYEQDIQGVNSQTDRWMFLSLFRTPT